MLLNFQDCQIINSITNNKIQVYHLLNVLVLFNVKPKNIICVVDSVIRFVEYVCYFVIYAIE